MNLKEYNYWIMKLGLKSARDKRDTLQYAIKIRNNRETRKNNK